MHRLSADGNGLARRVALRQNGTAPTGVHDAVATGADAPDTARDPSTAAASATPAATRGA
jgi:hypothetical protein